MRGGALLGRMGSAGSPWVGEGQGLLRGDGFGDEPRSMPAPGCRCWGKISSTSSSTSPSISYSSPMTEFSASRVELLDVGMLPQILSTLISSSRLFIQPGLLRRMSMVFPFTVEALKDRAASAEYPSKNVTHIFSSTNLIRITSPK